MSKPHVKIVRHPEDFEPYGYYNVTLRSPIVMTNDDLARFADFLLEIEADDLAAEVADFLDSVTK